MAQKDVNIMLTFLDKEEEQILVFLAGSIRNNIEVTLCGRWRNWANGGLGGKKVCFQSLCFYIAYFLKMCYAILI